jgi:hypothetical protein
MFKILWPALQFVVLLLTYARERQLIDAGQQRAIADMLRKQADLVDKANKTRDRVRTTIAGGGVYHDEFERPD